MFLSSRWIVPAAISVVLVFSFYVHLFRDLIPYADDEDKPAAAFSNDAALPQPYVHHHNLVIRELPNYHSRSHPTSTLESILFPDWETILVLPLPSTFADNRNLSCLFHNGAVSPAGFAGTLPTSPSRAAFRCPIPNSVRRLRPFYKPRLVDPTTVPESDDHDTPSEMIRWNHIAYEAVSTPSDVIVFAKGINRPASDIRCLFSSGAVSASAAVTPATSFAQEVFRCPHPPRRKIKNRRGPSRLPPDREPGHANPLHGQLPPSA